MKELEYKLIDRGVKPTAVRLLIFKAMVEYPQAFSMTDIEEVLETVDKSTISRTITVLARNNRAL